MIYLYNFGIFGGLSDANINNNFENNVSSMEIYKQEHILIN